MNMTRPLRWLVPPFMLAVAVCLPACVSTPFKGQPASMLTDDQLVTELQSVYQQLGLSTAGLYQLRAMMPPPKLVITERSFTTMSLNTNFVGDSAYTTGTATTTGTVDTYDQNEMNRSMNQLAQNIQLARINSLSSRRYELEAEARRRVAASQREEQELQAAVAEFFRAHPTLEDERNLLATILPWERADSYRETLERVAFEAELVLAARATGRPDGRWYGTLQLRSESPDGTSQPSTLPVRGDLVSSQGGVTLNLHFLSGATAVVVGALRDDLSFAGHLVLKGKPERVGSPGLEPHVLLEADTAGSETNGEFRLTFTKESAPTKETLTGILTLLR